MKRWVVGFSVVVALVAAAVVVRYDLRAHRPNVVLVIGCTVRADQTTLLNPALRTTPFLAGLARRGVHFADAIAAAPWTRASSGALLTGVHPGRLGLMDPNPGRDDRALSPSATLLSETLHRAGWTTVGVTANPNLDRVFGFDQGFDAYTSLTPRWKHKVVTDKVHGDEVVAKAVDLVRAHAVRSRPTYVQALFIDAHRPYQERVRRVPPRLPKRVASYRAALHTFDARVRDLHDGLARLGMTDENTIFVVVNDHGEGLSWPRYNGPGHGRYPYPAIVREVWAMAGPGIPAGEVVRGVASGVDVTPTLLGLLHLHVPSGVDGKDLSGPVRHGGRTGRKMAFTATCFLDTDRAGVFTDDTYCMKDFDPVQSERREELRRWPHFRAGCFDRHHPPFTTPVPDPALAGRLVAWHTALPIDTGTQANATVPPDVARDLQALGYTDDEDEGSGRDASPSKP